MGNAIVTALRWQPQQEWQEVVTALEWLREQARKAFVTAPGWQTEPEWQMLVTDRKWQRASRNTACKRRFPTGGRDDPGARKPPRGLVPPG